MNWMCLREPALQLSTRFDPVISISTRERPSLMRDAAIGSESVTDIEHTIYYGEAD